MIVKSTNKIGKIFIFLGIFISVHFIFKVEGKDLITEIIQLAQEERDLDEKTIKATVFKLAEEQIAIASDTEKYILKDTEDNIWSFKPDSKNEVQNAKMVSDIAQLLEISIPILDGIILPINGEEIFGSVQKIGFSDIMRLEKVSIKDLSVRQISSLQKLQVLDWLLIASKGEITEHCFIVSMNSNKILGIDSDDCFQNVKDGKLLGEKQWRGSIYGRLWDFYTNGELDVDFTEVFQLIDFIQQINDNEFIKILVFLNSKDKRLFLEEVLWRKRNLRREFEKFYRNLAERRGKKFCFPLQNDYKNYLENILEGKKKRVLIKRAKYKLLMDKHKKEQKNIEVVSAREVWNLIRYDLFGGKDKCLDEIIKKIRIIGEKSFYIGEYLTAQLYVGQLKTKQKLNVYRIIKHPKMLNPSEIECNLRVNNYDIFLSNNYEKISALKKDGEMLTHLKYIAKMKVEDRDGKSIRKYTQLLLTSTEKDKYQFLLALSQAKYYFDAVLGKVKMVNNDEVKSVLGKIDDNFFWKYYGLAFCDYAGGDIQRGIKGCKETICLSNDKKTNYAAYMLLGFLYEHAENVRFAKGFNIEKAMLYYRKALKIKPDSVESHLNLGVFYLLKELPQKALKEFKKIEELNPEYTRKHFHLDKIKRKSAYENKRKYLEAVKMNTLSGEDHYLLGLVYVVKKRNKLSKKHFDKAKEFGYKCDINESKDGILY